ncbi:hypothetical protein AN958_01440 [Leucoagaricus sp. SymC.cos]|nr:hypothetical protein AN958_01440 [Leucoagaricus sp. SymC.cos]
MTSQGDQNNPLTSEHERRLRVMALNEMAVGFAKGPIEYLWRFYMALFSIRPKGRINYYYVESLMVFKEPGLRLSLFHEYIIAKIRSIEPQDKKVFYLLLERTAGQLNRQRKREEHIPEQMEEMVAEIDKMIDDEEAKDEETLSHAPDRQMEDTMFNPRRGWSRTSTSNIRSRNTDENLYDRPGIFTAAANLASTSSESSSGNFLLAEDWFEILDRPQRAPDDVLIAEIVFRPPPERLAGENPERPDASTSVLSNTAPGTSVINQSIVDFHLSSRPPNSSPVSLAATKAFSRSTTSFESSRKPSPAQRPNPGRRHLHPVSPSLDASSRFSRSVPADIHKATGLRKTQTSSPLSISSLPPRPRPPRRSSSLDDTSATQQAPVKQASSIHTSPHKHLSTYKQSSPNTPRHFLDVPPLKETSNLHHLGSANSSESFLPVLSSPVPPARSLASPDDEDTLSSLHLPSPVSDINVEGPDTDADPLEDPLLVMRAGLRSVLGAVGIKQKGPPKPSPSAHWFDEYTIADFWGQPFSMYYLQGEEHGLEAWYVVELRVMRQRLPKKDPPKTCREYVVATVAKSELRDPTGNGYLVFERIKDRRPTMGWDPAGAHPDRTRESEVFEERKPFESIYTDEDFEKYLDFTDRPRARYMHVDRVRIVAKPYLFEADETIAVISLPPPERKKQPEVPADGEKTPTNTTPTNTTLNLLASSHAVTPTESDFFFPEGVVPKFPTLYVWELVYIAGCLNQAKELYHIFPNTVHWLSGMLIHICRAWTGADLVLYHRDGKGSVTIPATQEMQDWYEQQQRMMESKLKPKEREKEDYSDVVRIIKTPRNTTINDLVETYWGFGNDEDVIGYFEGLEIMEREHQMELDHETYLLVKKIDEGTEREVREIIERKAAEYKAEREEWLRGKALLAARQKKVRIANEKEDAARKELEEKKAKPRESRGSDGKPNKGDPTSTRGERKAKVTTVIAQKDSKERSAPTKSEKRPRREGADTGALERTSKLEASSSSEKKQPEERDAKKSESVTSRSQEAKISRGVRFADVEETVSRGVTANAPRVKKRAEVVSSGDRREVKFSPQDDATSPKEGPSKLTSLSPERKGKGKTLSPEEKSAEPLTPQEVKGKGKSTKFSLPWKKDKEKSGS